MKLDVYGVGYYYDAAETSGFNNISFSVEDGEVMSILGPNGCGKTTLLKCINSLIKIGKGNIAIDNKNLSGLPRAEIARAIGYVPQLHQPAFPFSVLDTVLVGRAPHLGLLESPKPNDLKIAEQSLETMGIYHLKDKPYTELSGGERQMVIFARVLAQQPSLLLLDEPTSHLDFGNQIRVLRIVGSLAATGLPIIMTSHFPDHAFLVSTKVALMKQGEFLDIGTPDGVITDSNLEKVYNIKVKVINVDSGVNRKICVPVEECSPVTDSKISLHTGGSMSDFDIFLKKAGDSHGHICMGIALGTRISLAAMKALGLKPGERHKNLIVYAEIDRCMTDAVQVITGCSLGHRSLKHMDYGKFAATFINTDTGKAVRGFVREHYGNDDPIEVQLKNLARIPDSDLITLQEVTIDIPKEDLPGMPTQKAVCAACGETIMDGREVKEGNKTLCKACARGAYYKECKK
jgi:iron complex transport system ATP-binding protein